VFPRARNEPGERLSAWRDASELVAKFQDPHARLKGTLITIATRREKLPAEAYAEYCAHVPATNQIPKELLALIRAIRTQLDRFTDIECEALMYHACTLTDAALWAHRQGCPPAYRVADIPAPQWRIDFTPDVVARWT
jgi:hypothetical protein